MLDGIEQPGQFPQSSILEDLSHEFFSGDLPGPDAEASDESQLPQADDAA